MHTIRRTNQVTVTEPSHSAQPQCLVRTKSQCLSHIAQLEPRHSAQLVTLALVAAEHVQAAQWQSLRLHALVAAGQLHAAQQQQLCLVALWPQRSCTQPSSSSCGCAPWQPQGSCRQPCSGRCACVRRGSRRAVAALRQQSWLVAVMAA